MVEIAIKCREEIIMSENEIVKYYNKFCEDKRLLSRHGQVEFAVTMHYIKKHLEGKGSLKILDVGAGTGRYSFALSDMGHEVVAVELVKYNLGILKSKGKNIEAYQGDARNLRRFMNDSFDVVLLFGPMYHLLSHEDKLKALGEAKRIVKKGGLIFISYLMNEYAVLVHGFRDNYILEEINLGRLSKDFEVVAKEPDLYSYVRVEDIDKLLCVTELERVEIVSQDGATDYMRDVINVMSEDVFELYIKYQISVSGRRELLGASSHVLDILRK